MEENSLTELEKLTDSIVRGERVVLFAPGLWAVITTIFLLLFATVLLSASLISIYGSGLELSNKAIYQFTGLVFVLLFVITPGLLLFRGHRSSRRIKLYYSVALALINITSIFAVNENNHLIPLLISLGASLLSFFLINSPAYRLCSEFYFLLKIKRRG